jgi:hemoglobin-like flavoprotein
LIIAADSVALLPPSEKQNRPRQWRFSMTPSQIALVQSSFEKIAPIAPQAAALFYGRLFEMLPEARSMFKSEINEQGRKLMATLGAVVRSLNRLDAVMPVARALALRHVDFGVRPHHYGPVGAALLWTLEQALGAEFTPDTAAAWRAAYGMLSSAMIAAAYPAAVPS